MTTDDLLSIVVSRLDKLDAGMQTMHDHIVGTHDRRGLTRRVEDVERSQKTSWWRDRATKAIDALILGTVVALSLLVITNGVKSTLRDVVGSNAHPPCAIAKREIVAQRGFQLQRRSVNSSSEGE